MKNLAVIVMAALSMPLVGCAARNPVAVFNLVDCLDRTGPLVTLAGTQTTYDERSLGDGTRIDAAQAVWPGQSDKPVQLGGSNVCLTGGKIQGVYPDTTSWETMHGTYGILAYGSSMLVENVRIDDYGDGVSFNSENASNWVIRSSHFSFLRDDCVENDFLNNGIIDDALYDGCYNFYSARAYGGFPRDGSGNVVTIRGSLIRLQAMPTVYSGPAPGHELFFKLDRGGLSPKLALHDNIFRVDQLPSTGSPSSGMYFIPPPEKLGSCSNNTIVWLAPENFPEPLPSCYTLTRDKSVWDRAVAQWLSQHPAVP